MVVQFAFLHIVLILWSTYPLASAQDNIIAQPGCNSTCGVVKIPYPFGMTHPSCYADKGFEIECRNNTPFLKSIDNLEVTDIDVNQGNITIMNPIYRMNCQRKNATPGIDMRGSPFVYSHGMNKFVFVGCNNLALLVSNGSEVGGCVSICDNNDVSSSSGGGRGSNFTHQERYESISVNNHGSLSNTYSGTAGCLGRSCCVASLPMYLSEYNATFEDIRRNTGATDECRYAVIVGDYYLDGRNVGAYLKDLDYVPASLEWEILNSTLGHPFANCYETDITSSEKKHSGWRCSCSPGFRGNPYVSGGCTAIPGYSSGKNRAKWVIVDNIIAQPGCNSTCGGVDIPYPFGMTNHSCYADKWFEIECRNNTPFLKLIDNLEVTDIDVYRGTVTIMNPIYRRNCQSKNATRCIDMRGSPFVYSQGMNKFVGVGCNNLALLVSNGSKIGGCVSICDNNDEYLSKTYLGSDGCLGRSCCQTSLPMYLSEYYATFEDIRRNTGATDECRYALIVGDYFLDGMNLSAYLKDLDYVPASLEWEILNSSLRFPYANCYETNITSSEKKHSGRRCDCGLGFDGNPYVSGGCTAIPGYFSGKNRGKNRAKWVIVGILLSLGFVVFNVFLGSKILRRRRIQKRKEKYFKQNGGFLLKQRLSSGEIQTKLFDLKDLEKATNCFNVSNVLGKGGQGTVYKGMLVDGQIVAVKKFRVQGNVEGFINEVVILSQINHRNVVKLLGVCLETEVPLLVYEFISNGNLFQYLHDQNEDLPMTWEMRVRIATEVAGALHYLHSAASQPIYHRDVKSTNILLDEKYSAKVADFGTSRMVTIEATHLTTLVRGTFGYLDPEYFHTSQFTEKSDVYSFGVVLVELLTGQKPIFSTRTEEAENLASYFMMSMAEDRLFDILDRKIMEGENEEITAVAKLAGRCLELNGRKRPTMKEVTKDLEGIQKWGKRSDIAEQDHEKIAAFGIEAYHRWAVDSASTGSTLNSKASSSSAMNEEVQSN